MNALISIFFIGLSLTGFSQIYENFKLQRIENKVYISWTMTEGNTCNGIQVQRSTDSLNFKTIHDIQGVCGSTSKNVFYEYTDTIPQLDSKNYYRLILGTLGVSEIISIKMTDIRSDEIKIFPNPTVENVSIQYGSTYVKLCIFDLRGAKVYEKALDKSQSLVVPINEIQSGVYLFKFYTTNEKSITKKVVLN